MVREAEVAQFEREGNEVREEGGRVDEAVDEDGALGVGVAEGCEEGGLGGKALVRGRRGVFRMQ